MWARFRRRTMAPRRPMIWPEQRVLAGLTLVVLVASVAFALYVVFA